MAVAAGTDALCSPSLGSSAPGIGGGEGCGSVETATEDPSGDLGGDGDNVAGYCDPEVDPIGGRRCIFSDSHAQAAAVRGAHEITPSWHQSCNKLHRTFPVSTTKSPELKIPLVQLEIGTRESSEKVFPKLILGLSKRSGKREISAQSLAPAFE